MAAPGQIRTETLAELRAARRAMSTAPFLMALASQPEDVREQAAIKLLNAELAIRSLETAELGAIRDRLIENEAGLIAGIAQLRQARENLAKVAKVLSALGEVLGVVAKVVKFAAIGL